jgi:uncharacterized protein YbjT (DUF2867 family)
MPAVKKIAVAGATGRVGHHVVDLLTERGHDVARVSRRHGVDVITGEGLADALAGVECIVDATSGPSPEQQAATEFFTMAAGNVQGAGRRAGVQRIIVVSIIGTDRLKGGYGVAKVAHEQATLAGPIPARVLRAAQFHEFVEQLVQWGTQGEASSVPKMRTQLVAARTVAEALADLAVDPRGSAGADARGRRAPRGEPRRDGEAARRAARRCATGRGRERPRRRRRLRVRRPAAEPRREARWADLRGVARGGQSLNSPQRSVAAIRRFRSSPSVSSSAAENASSTRSSSGSTASRSVERLLSRRRHLDLAELFVEALS